MRTMILVNPRAREGRVGEKWPQLERELLGALGEGEATVEFTTATDYGSGMVRKALRDGVERVLVVGGDGTISEAVQGFFENGRALPGDATLMVMPAGRGDDFFKSMIDGRLKSSTDAWQKGLEVLRHGKSEPTDLGWLSWLSRSGSGSKKGAERAFVNIASFGYPGLVVKKVHDRTGLLAHTRAAKSAWAYLAQSTSALVSYVPVRVEVKIDGEGVFDGPLFSGFVLNGRYNAGGVCWAREARIDDGLFHVVLIEPRDLLSTVLSGPSLVSGDWRNAKGVHTYVGKKVEVRVRDDKPRDYPFFEIDGDQPEAPGCQGAVFECLPGAIRLWR